MRRIGAVVTSATEKHTNPTGKKCKGLCMDMFADFDNFHGKEEMDHIPETVASPMMGSTVGSVDRKNPTINGS